LKEAFCQVNNENTGTKGADTCSATIFTEKLFTARNMFGSIKAICKVWKPSAETLEQWVRDFEQAKEDPPDDPRKIEMIE